MGLLSSALSNLVVLVLVPFGIYFGYLKWRRKVPAGEIVRRTGLQIGEARYIKYCLIMAFIVVAGILIWPPDIAHYDVEGSAFRSFVGAGLTASSVFGALLYGVIQTGFAEEFLFRGLIAGSLGRKLPILWANLIQAVIFLLPHLMILTIAPEMWGILPIVFVGALIVGWMSIKSGSFVGPWIVHAAANVTVALSVAVRSVA